MSSRLLAERGQDVINAEVAPITVTDGVQFLVVVGVALIAWVVDAIAVTWRQATLAGIPLLALYLVPAIVLPDGVPWPLFLLAGAGWLLLLLTDGRSELAKWGRPVDDRRSRRFACRPSAEPGVDSVLPHSPWPSSFRCSCRAWTTDVSVSAQEKKTANGAGWPTRSRATRHHAQPDHQPATRPAAGPGHLGALPTQRTRPRPGLPAGRDAGLV